MAWGRGRSVNLSRSAVLRGLPGANGFVLSFLTKPYAAAEEVVRCSAAGEGGLINYSIWSGSNPFFLHDFPSGTVFPSFLLAHASEE